MKPSKKEIIISLKEINKIYPIGGGNKFHALKQTNLNIYKGDHIGIVGNNGAGKTTLLKIITGITKPTSGTIRTKGKIVSLIDLEAGFHPELSGKENIYINGMLVGMNRNEIKKNEKLIFKFANIGTFINEPFYTYSSGMKFRLAFAIAIVSKCDILIMDEIFASGDRNFQLKSFKLINKILADKNITLIICSHIYSYVAALSTKYYRLTNGVIKKITEHDILSQIKSNDKKWEKIFNLKSKFSSKTND